MLIQEAHAIFLADRRVNGCTPATLAFYEYTIGSLVSFVQEQCGEDIEISEISGYINPFFISLQERDFSPHTCHTCFRAIRTFTRFIHAESYIEKKVKLPGIKAPQSVIRPISPEQMSKALCSFNTRRFTGLRNQTILRLFFDTGMRLSELAGIELPEMNFDEGFILIYGKGGKERWIPFGKETKKALWRYVKRREKIACVDESAVFVTQSGTKITPRGVQMIFRRLGKKLNLEGIRFSPHTFRHSFALAYIENGGDPFSLQRILGHSSQAMTAKYINMARSNVKAQHSKFSPGDRI